MSICLLLGILALSLLVGPSAAQERQTTAAASSFGNWRLVGPTDAEPMEDVEGGDVGRINAFVFHPSQPHTIFAATPVGGLWRTQDDGAKWELLTNFAKTGIQDIAIDPLAPDTIYVLTGDGEGGSTVGIYYGLSPPSIGVFKSMDGGRSWSPTGLSFEPGKYKYGFRLAIDPSNPAILIVAMSDGLYRTSDGGTMWKKVKNSSEPCVDVIFHPTDSNVVYAASSSRVYRSNDGGEHWQSLAGADQPRSIRTRLAVTRASPDTLYVLFGARDGFSIGLFRSDDRGNHFAKRSSTDPFSKDPNAPAPINLTKPNIFGREDNDFASQAYYDIAMAVSPADSDEIYVGGIDIWRSRDGAKTWKRISKWDVAFDEPPRYVHADVHMLAYHEGMLYAATDGGIYRANDPESAGSADAPWQSITRMKTGITLAQIYHVCSSPMRPDVLYYGAQDNGTYRLDISGKIRQVGGGDGFVCQVDPRDPETLYINANQTIHRTYKAASVDVKRGSCKQPDGDEDWWCDYKDVTPRNGTTELPGAWVTPYILGADPEGTNGYSIYACYADLWKSADRGDHWSNLSKGALGPSAECRQVAVSPADPKTIYVGKQGERGKTPFFGGGGVFRSVDGGVTWRPVSGNLPFDNLFLTDVAVSPADPRRVWVTFLGNQGGKKVFMTTNGGTTWNDISRGLPNNSAHTIAAANGANNPVYVGMDDGVYYRDDTMENWEAFKQGLPIDNNGLPIVVTSLLLQEAQHRLFAATYGRGVWLSELRAP